MYIYVIVCVYIITCYSLGSTSQMFSLIVQYVNALMIKNYDNVQTKYTNTYNVPLQPEIQNNEQWPNNPSPTQPHCYRSSGSPVHN